MQPLQAKGHYRKGIVLPQNQQGDGLIGDMLTSVGKKAGSKIATAALSGLKETGKAMAADLGATLVTQAGDTAKKVIQKTADVASVALKDKLGKQLDNINKVVDAKLIAAHTKDPKPTERQEVSNPDPEAPTTSEKVAQFINGRWVFPSDIANGSGLAAREINHEMVKNLQKSIKQKEARRKGSGLVVPGSGRGLRVPGSAPQTGRGLASL